MRDYGKEEAEMKKKNFADLFGIICFMDFLAY